MFSKAKNKKGSINSGLVEIGVEDQTVQKQMTATNAKMAGNAKKPAPRPSGVPSLISSDVFITGTINAAGEVQFDGTLEGDIKAKGLVIGDGATVQGQVIADKVRVLGNVHGSINANVVELATSALVTGDIIHSSLSIESGAKFDGSCRHSEDPTSETPKITNPAPRPATKPAPKKPVPRPAPQQQTNAAANGAPQQAQDAIQQGQVQQGQVQQGQVQQGVEEAKGETNFLSRKGKTDLR